jgi:prepilin-type processing-associated H-X9-DG protein
MRQLGLAMTSYHDTHRKFPLAAVDHPAGYFSSTATANFRDAAPNPPGVWGTTWAVSILPQIEQKALFDLWNPNIGYNSPTQRQVTGAPIQVYKCPSDLTAPVAIDPDGGNNFGTFDKGNYGLNFGGGCANENSGGGAGPDESPSWALQRYSRASRNRGLASLRDSNGLSTNVGLNDLIDGASNVVLIGEMLHLNNNGDCRGCWGKALGAAISAYTGGTPNVDGPEGIATPNVKATPRSIYSDHPTHCGNGAAADDPDLDCNDRGGDGKGGNAMRSRHPGGVQATFGDGRVQFLNNTIDKLVYRSLLTAQGRESVTAP